MKNHSLNKSLAKQLFFFVFVIILSLLLAFSLTNMYVKNSVKKNTQEMNHKILVQVEGKIKDFYSSMNHIMTAMVYSPTTEVYLMQNNLERVISSDDLSMVFSNTMLLDENIAGIYLYDRNMNLIASTGKYRDVEQLAGSLKKEMEFSNLFYMDQTETIYYLIYYPIFDLRDSQYGNQVGMSALLMKAEGLHNFIKDSKATEHAEIYLIDSKGNIAVSYGGNTEDHLPEEMQETTKDYYVQSQNAAMQGWKIVSRIPQEELYQSAENGKGAATVAYGIACILIMVLAYFCYRNFILRIYEVDQFIKNIISCPKERMPEHSWDEIGSVIHSLNRMLDDKEDMELKMQESQKRMYEIELAEKQLQVLAYRNQINPHFLYNTFDCIRGMALYKGEKEIAKITMALSKVFRFAVKGENIVTVRDEIDYIKEYATIIDYRFMGKIKVFIDVEEELYEKHVIKLMLQPIVENAVFHGLEQKMGEGRVSVVIRSEKEGYMLLTVEDDGCGINKEELENIRLTLDSKMSKKGIGLANIYQRLRLFYGDEVQFDIQSETGTGTRVNILIPDEIKEKGEAYV